MSSSYRNITVMLLSLIIVIGFILEVYLILSGKLDMSDPGRASLIGQVIGYMQGLASSVCAYYFGTTKSSEDKNSTIASIADKIPTTPSTQTLVATATTTNQEKTK